MVAEFVKAYKTDEQIPNQQTGCPVEVFITLVSNVSGFLVEETLTKYVKLSSVVIEDRYLRGKGLSIAGFSDRFGIITGFPNLRFCLFFA